MLFSWKWKSLDEPMTNKKIKKMLKEKAKEYNGYGNIYIKTFLFLFIIYYKTETEYVGEHQGDSHYDRYTLLVIGRLKYRKDIYNFRGFAIYNFRYTVIFFMVPIIVTLLNDTLFGNGIKFDNISIAICFSLLCEMLNIFTMREHGVSDLNRVHRWIDQSLLEIGYEKVEGKDDENRTS